MFPHVVTLYNEVVEIDQNTMTENSVNHITVLRGVLMEASKAKNVNESGLQDADAVNLYIPFSVDAHDGITGSPRKYVGPVEFWRTEDKSGIWTLSVGEQSTVVKGEAVHENWSSQKLEAMYDDVYNITKVDAKDFGGDMAHWEVGCK